VGGVAPDGATTTALPSMLTEVRDGDTPPVRFRPSSTSVRVLIFEMVASWLLATNT
jgi:hypothetical protein